EALQKRLVGLPRSIRLTFRSILLRGIRGPRSDFFLERDVLLLLPVEERFGVEHRRESVEPERQDRIGLRLPVRIERRELGTAKGGAVQVTRPRFRGHGRRSSTYLLE